MGLRISSWTHFFLWLSPVHLFHFNCSSEKLSSWLPWANLGQEVDSSFTSAEKQHDPFHISILLFLWEFYFPASLLMQSMVDRVLRFPPPGVHTLYTPLPSNVNKTGDMMDFIGPPLSCLILQRGKDFADVMKVPNQMTFNKQKGEPGRHWPYRVSLGKGQDPFW